MRDFVSFSVCWNCWLLGVLVWWLLFGFSCLWLIWDRFLLILLFAGVSWLVGIFGIWLFGFWFYFQLISWWFGFACFEYMLIVVCWFW